MPHDGQVITSQRVPATLALKGVQHMDQQQPPQQLAPGEQGSKQQEAPSIGRHILKVRRDSNLEE
eukprot:3676863-Prorocentrum_lima.AAC.1